jgi:hypothetical protein
VSERIHCFEISRDVWNQAIAALRARGWSLDMGGGLDHSWAVLERDGLRVEMDYDIWAGGELALFPADRKKANALLPTTVLAMLGGPW